MCNTCYLKFKKLHDDAVIPEPEHEGDAGLDVTCVESFGLPPGAIHTTMVGLSYTITPRHYIQVCSRSGMARDSGIFVLNSPGILDENYRGEIGVILHNSSEFFTTIHKGSRIAQFVVAKLPITIVTEVYALDNTERGDGGFGSTDKPVLPDKVPMRTV